MRLVALTALVLLVSGCMTMRPVEQPFQQQIGSEQPLTTGDKVRVVTTDGVVHEFRIDAVDLESGRITGEDHDIEIASIATLEKKQVSSLKTGLLVGLLVVGLLGSDCEGDPCGEFGGGPFCCG